MLYNMYIFKGIHFTSLSVLSTEVITDHWMQSTPSGLEKIDTFCIELSSSQLQCMFKRLNTASTVKNFTVSGTVIQDDGDINIKGNYADDGTIVWYNGTIIYRIWKRSNGFNSDQSEEQNMPEPSLSTIGNNSYTLIQIVLLSTYILNLSLISIILNII